MLDMSRRRPVMRSREELLEVAAAVATPKRELMFTTVSMDNHKYQLVFLRQWLGHLGARARNVLIVGANEETCTTAREASLPCFVDGASPRQRGKQNGFGNQVTLKWWVAMVLAQANFHLIFSDPDIAWLRDPFHAWDRSYDFQGLSDIRHVNVTTQKHHEITCLRPWMENMYEHGKRSIYPCQSTGMWYARATPPTKAFLEGLHGYLAVRPNEWEQKAYQLIVMRYLVGLGDELPPLRYRLLPTARHINIEYYEERLRLGLPVDGMVGVHCGYLKEEGDKIEHLERHGFLRRGIERHAMMARLLANQSVQGFVYNASLALRLRRKRNSSISVVVR
tara:strand:+ start:214 stop:1221 length:1008 start_codon:yes stop_codon:yes gene_type:complete